MSKTIGQVCSRFSSGKSIKSEQINSTGLYPVYGGNGLRGYTDTYNFDGECVIIGRQGAYCGNVRYYFGKAYMTEHAIVACANADNCTAFLSYKLSSMNLSQYQGQSAQPGLSVTTLSKVPITLPDYDTQCRIAKILSTIDAKISNNNRINAELESMAKTIYDYWFTQFDFPDENGKPYKSSGGKMVWNEELKREIPEGWGIKKLDEFSKVITKGTTPSTLGGEFVDKSNISFIKVESIENGFINGDISYISEKTQELMQRSKLEENDILITIAGRLGSVCVVPDFVLPANTNQAVAIVRLLDKDLVWFLRASMMSDENKYYYANVNAQSIQKNLNLPNVGNTKIMCDNELKYADLYNKKVNSIYKKINSNIQQNQQLSSLRDWLLPMLMNGQVGFEGE